MKRRALVWRGEPHAVQLVWSYSTKDGSGRFAFRPEYIRVEFVSSKAVSKAPQIRRSTTVREKKSVSLTDIRTAVQRKPDGDTYIDGTPSFGKMRWPSKPREVRLGIRFVW